MIVGNIPPSTIATNLKACTRFCGCRDGSPPGRDLSRRKEIFVSSEMIVGNIPLSPIATNLKAYTSFCGYSDGSPPGRDLSPKKEIFVSTFESR